MKMLVVFSHCKGVRWVKRESTDLSRVCSYCPITGVFFLRELMLLHFVGFSSFFDKETS